MSIELTSLPVELKEAIFEQCAADFQSLKNIRLTCKCFALIAEKLLFRELHVGIFRTSVDKVAHIAAHPRIRKHVNRILVQADVVTKLGVEDGLGQWETLAQYDAVTTAKLFKGVCSGREVAERYWLRNKYANEQLNFDLGIEGKTFERAVLALSELRSIAIVRLSDHVSPSVLEPLYSQFDPRLNCDRSVVSTPREESPKALLMVLSALSARHTANPKGRAISLKCSVDSSAGLVQHLASTHINFLQRSPFLPVGPARFTDLPTQRMHMNAPSLGFSALKELTITIGNGTMTGWRDEAVTPKSAEQLTTALNHCTRLQSLHLTIAEHRTDNSPCLSDGLLHAHFPHLTTFTLTSASWHPSATTTSPLLLTFLTTHASTLLSISLTGVAFSPNAGSWATFFHDLPPLPCLESFVLDHCLEAGDDLPPLSKDSDGIFAWEPTAVPPHILSLLKRPIGAHHTQPILDAWLANCYAPPPAPTFPPEEDWVWPEEWEYEEDYDEEEDEDGQGRYREEAFSWTAPRGEVPMWFPSMEMVRETNARSRAGARVQVVPEGEAWAEESGMRRDEWDEVWDDEEGEGEEKKEEDEWDEWEEEVSGLEGQ